MAITILGLGPGDPGHLTREAWEVLSGAEEIYLRTSRHPTVDALATLPSVAGHPVVHSFDALYEAADDLPAVYEEIARRVLELGRRPQGVLYAVPGDPLVGETSVQRILAGARKEGLAVRLVHGLSFVEPVLGVVGVDALEGLQLADATALAAAHHPPLDPDRPALVGQLYGQGLAGDVKLTLMNAYPDDHPVTVVRAAGTAGQSAQSVPLHELDRGRTLDHLATLYVPPLPGVTGMPGLQETIAHLRAPDGCPWDREQTHQSLRPHLLEESYEVLAALDADDGEELCEELGDLLMQVAMHVQIASEEGSFRFADVVSGIDAKLKRRHPHVFGDVHVRDSADVLRNWEAIKAGEREAGRGEGRGQPVLADRPGRPAPAADPAGEGSALAGVPAILPALARAQVLGDRAARSGFDWADAQGVVDKVAEEAGELAGETDREARAAELGDLLFTLANLARWLEVDAESALRGACERFTRRYQEMERLARSQGIPLGRLSPAEQDALWEKAKLTDGPFGATMRRG